MVGCIGYKLVGKFNLVRVGLLVVLNRCAAEQYCTANVCKRYSNTMNRRRPTVTYNEIRTLSL